MSPIVYHILHVVGVIIVFVGIGGLAGNDDSSRRKAMMFHGIGLLVLLISGFGLLGKLKIPFSASWVIVMGVVWLALGAMPVLVKRGLPAPVALWISIALGGIAAWAGYLKDAAW